MEHALDSDHPQQPSTPPQERERTLVGKPPGRSFVKVKSGSIPGERPLRKSVVAKTGFSSSRQESTTDSKHSDRKKGIKNSFRERSSNGASSPRSAVRNFSERVSRPRTMANSSPKNTTIPSPVEENDSTRDYKIQKLLARSGFGSRRDMEDHIRAGRVFINGKKAVLGQRARISDKIEYDQKNVPVSSLLQDLLVLAYHKPTGEIVSNHDPQQRRTVFESLPPPSSGRWIAIGRLDYNTEGLLLLTNSGDLANQLMHPRYEIERQYAVRANPPLDDTQVTRLLEGVKLEDGLAHFLKLEPAKESRDEDKTGVNRWYTVSLCEGRNREVRRLFEAVGAEVSRLIRTRYGPIALPDTLEKGQSLLLSSPQLALLQDSAIAHGKNVHVPATPQAGSGDTAPDLEKKSRVRDYSANRSRHPSRARSNKKIGDLNEVKVNKINKIDHPRSSPPFARTSSTVGRVFDSKLLDLKVSPPEFRPRSASRTPAYSSKVAGLTAGSRNRPKARQSSANAPLGSPSEGLAPRGDRGDGKRIRIPSSSSARPTSVLPRSGPRASHSRTSSLEASPHPKRIRSSSNRRSDRSQLTLDGRMPIVPKHYNEKLETPARPGPVIIRRRSKLSDFGIQSPANNP